MITYNNMMESVRAWLLANPGCSTHITDQQLDSSGMTAEQLQDWVTNVNAEGITLRRGWRDCWNGVWISSKADENAPVIPPEGTPLNQLSTGNRFRAMFGQPLLPEGKSTEEGNKDEQV